MVDTNTHGTTSKEAEVEGAPCITWADVRGDVDPPDPVLSDGRQLFLQVRDNYSCRWSPGSSFARVVVVHVG